MIVLPGSLILFRTNGKSQRRPSRYEIQMREFFGIGLRIEPAGAGDILEAMRIPLDIDFPPVGCYL